MCLTPGSNKYNAVYNAIAEFLENKPPPDRSFEDMMASMNLQSNKYIEVINDTFGTVPSTNPAEYDFYQCGYGCPDKESQYHKCLYFYGYHRESGLAFVFVQKLRTDLNKRVEIDTLY